MVAVGHGGWAYGMSPGNPTEDDFKVYQANLARGKGTVGGSLNKAGRAIARPSPGVLLPTPSPKYRSKWDAAFANKLELEKRAGLIKAYWYEPFSLWLPGKVRYKPDYLIQYPDGLEQRLEIVEIKGWSRNLRDGMTRLKIAAALFPCFTWRLVRRTRNGSFDGEYL